MSFGFLSQFCNLPSGHYTLESFQNPASQSNLSSFSNLLTFHYSSFQFFLLVPNCFANQSQITYPYLEGLFTTLPLLMSFSLSLLRPPVCSHFYMRTRFQSMRMLWIQAFALKKALVFSSFLLREEEFELSYGLKFTNASGNTILYFVYSLFCLTPLVLCLPFSLHRLLLKAISR